MNTMSARLISITPFEDFRGSLKKILKKSNIGKDLDIEEAYVLYSKKGAIRGNHYHKETTEYFCVLKGSVKFATKVVGKEHIEEISIDEGDNIVVEVPPLTAYAIINEKDEKAIILVLSTKEYDENYNDTYKMVLY